MSNCTITKTFHRGMWSDQSARSLATKWAWQMRVLAEEAGITVSIGINAPVGVYIVNRIEGRKATATVQFENDADCALFKLKYPDE